MILADTSVWIDHFRKADIILSELLNTNRVVMHPFVLGELALGHLTPRNAILTELGRLPELAAATEDEVLHLITAEALFGKGIGYIDAHLLAALRLMPGTKLWTNDKRLATAAAAMGLR